MPVLAIDRWQRHIGLARENNSNIISPLWQLENNQTLLFDLAGIIAQHHIKTVVVWRPNKQKNIQQKIKKFVTSLQTVIDPEISIDYANEDYSSVQAGALINDYNKHPSTDSLAACIILENWNKQTQNK